MSMSTINSNKSIPLSVSEVLLVNQTLRIDYCCSYKMYVAKISLQWTTFRQYQTICYSASEMEKVPTIRFVD